MHIIKLPDEVITHIIIYHSNFFNILGVNKSFNKLLKTTSQFKNLIKESYDFHKEKVVQHETILRIRQSLLLKETDYRSQQIYLGYIEDSFFQINTHTHMKSVLSKIIFSDN